MTLTEQQHLKRMLIKHGAREVMRCLSNAERSFSEREEASPLLARNTRVLHECYIDLCKIEQGA